MTISGSGGFEVNKTQSLITVGVITLASSIALHKWKHNWVITIAGGAASMLAAFILDTQIQKKMQG